MLKKLSTSLLFKLLALFLGTFFTLFLASYALFHKFILLHVAEDKLVVAMNDFNETWCVIGLIFAVLFTVAYFVIKRTLKSVTDDIDKINNYLQALNEKKYDAVLKVNHYLEFLQLSLLFKNLVKRLKNKKK